MLAVRTRLYPDRLAILTFKGGRDMLSKSTACVDRVTLDCAMFDTTPQGFRESIWQTWRVEISDHGDAHGDVV